MPPRIDFYVSEEAGADVRLRLACRITEKAYAAKQKVVVLLDAEDVRRFDELLWTFGDGSFVPHDVVDAAATTCEAPVALTTSSAPASHADVLVNLSRAVPPWFEQFGRVAEFLDARPEVRAAGRDRFRTYKGKSIEPQTHKV